MMGHFTKPDCNYLNFSPPFPDDHTRVRLRGNNTKILNNGVASTISRAGGGGEDFKDEYINANFIDGFRRPRAYIGTQVSPQTQLHSFLSR